MSRLTDLCREFRSLYDEKESLQDQLDDVKSRLHHLRTKTLPELMSDEDVQKITVDGAGMIFLQDKISAYVAKDDRVLYHTWLRANGHESLVVDHVWPATQNAWAKEQLTNGIPLPDVMKATFIPTAMIRRK